MTQDQIMPALVTACPSFKKRWERYLKDSYGPGEEHLLYIDLGEFADHVASLIEVQRHDEFKALSEMIEKLHVDGDPLVREAATVGLLEAFKNAVENLKLDPEPLIALLGVESRRSWDSLEEFWSAQTAGKPGE